MAVSPVTTAGAFHPAVAAWFDGRFVAPTPAQEQAWPAIRAGADTLIAAPTGSGKTLAAFLTAIDELVGAAQEQPLADATQILYVSPLKALSNDVHKNLEEPLAGIAAQLTATGEPDPGIRSAVRSGDTPQRERARMARSPPHILVTTPESLYLLLTSKSGRAMLANVRRVIVDEIHALAGNKRGAHLALSLARLDALTGRRVLRIGLSATQKPIATMAAFLTGRDDGDCTIVDIGYARERDLALCLPATPLSAVLSNETFGEIYDQLAALIRGHRSTLIFVNTRRLAERAARHLAERLGEDAVTAHHGSLAREHRLDAEQRLKDGQLQALVATASLELGIDIGAVDLVCQLGSPRAIATLLQRVGRSGHGVGGLPKGRLFPLSRDDLAECAALLDAANRGELDAISPPPAPLDVLAQQIVAEVAATGECDEEALYRQTISAWPYRGLTRAAFDATVRMLAAGFTTRRGRRGAHLHRDAVHGKLRPRASARLTALTNGGVIPDQFDCDVLLSPAGLRIGSLNEDFAFETLPGDIFQLGNHAYRILRNEAGKLWVEDARGAPPNIPFWFGEAPGRTDELSAAVSRLRAELDPMLAQGQDATRAWLVETYRVPSAAAHQLADYYGAARAALGALPTQETIVLERFFDEVGDLHLVVHSPFGSRLNRAWGLALRKRFCRKFNFELQAAALEDSIVLSLGETHSFVLEEVARYLHSATARAVLTQAALDAPVFGNRWRWNVTTALAVRRSRNGKRAPPQFQRSDAEDLMAVIFPDQLACAENLAGEREIPDHPLVTQTIRDCLEDTMDATGLEALLARLEAGEIQIMARDLPTPSPLAEEIINARNYAFLDDGAAEERRTRAVRSGGYWDANDLTAGQLDPAAIAKLREQAWPQARDAEELHDALVIHGFLAESEAAQNEAWTPLFAALCAEQRATAATLATGQSVWVAAERLQALRCLCADPTLDPPIEAVCDGPPPEDASAALCELLRGRLQALGPVTVRELAAPLALDESAISAALAQLEREGFAIQGHFSPDAEAAQWCERRLLARIHRHTVQRRRREIQTVSPQTYMRFLLAWHGVGHARSEGEAALADAVAQLEGYCLPAAAWETEVLPARIADYHPQMLDRLCAGGRVAWLRLRGPQNGQGAAPLRTTPIALFERAHLRCWRDHAPAAEAAGDHPSASARRLLQVLETQGASFFQDLQDASGLLTSQVEEGLAELAARGLASADSFAGLRALIHRAERRPRHAPRTRIRRRRFSGLEDAGRWSRIRPPACDHRNRKTVAADTEHIAWILLARYGVVCKQFLARESGLPPWRELLYAYHRLEARGEIRGGRFVDGFTGEQFAGIEAVAALRRQAKIKAHGDLVSLSAADPLNLTGIVIPGERLPAVSGNRLLLRDGLPVACYEARKLRFLTEPNPQTQWQWRNQLLRHGQPSGARDSAMPKH